MPSAQDVCSVSPQKGTVFQADLRALIPDPASSAEIRHRKKEDSNMKGIAGFRLRRRRTTPAERDTRAHALPAPMYDQAARDRVLAKLKVLGEAFYTMSEDEYGRWLDALPRDEFMQLMALMIELDDRSRRAQPSAAA